MGICKYIWRKIKIISPYGLVEIALITLKKYVTKLPMLSSTISTRFMKYTPTHPHTHT